MTRNVTPLAKTALVVALAGVCGALAGLLVPSVPLPPELSNSLVETLVRVKFGVATFNLAVLVALVAAYVDVYRDLPNKYTLSLLVTSLALLLYALSANPLVALLFGFPPHPALGPFGFLPDVFVAVAIVVLFYQSQT
ncbi:hypothetical protein GCM10009037_02770 [Halarchaeum grantii]|uniref:Uncharacterized protein n=1 Tax=Halarchaeum grantii TaxID=1193105 RepID=A0A830EYH4_9EURY|nr:hypothetical protein [Halarchaeum grantii]GGL22786.1 hypothetical protein GCM10009037_02770 [Halarchaeum grantii]